jgi:hypothetical protein
MKHLLLIAFLAACGHHPQAVEPHPELATRRAQMIGYLAEYTERGVFPTDERGLPLSVFEDARGVRCPMAELIYRSGHPELVAAIVAEDNHARLGDIHDGPVHDWMLGSGLTHDEIVMIQGIADINYGPLFKIEQPANVITAQRERVRGRLETAQAALRKDQRDSLTAATLVLPQHRVPVVKVTRPAIAKH